MRPPRPRDAVRHKLEKAKLPRRLDLDQADVIYIVGVLLVAAGGSWIYRPLGLLILGAFLLYVGWTLGLEPATPATGDGYADRIDMEVD